MGSVCCQRSSAVAASASAPLRDGRVDLSSVISTALAMAIAVRTYAAKGYVCRGRSMCNGDVACSHLNMIIWWSIFDQMIIPFLMYATPHIRW